MMRSDSFPRRLFARFSITQKAIVLYMLLILLPGCLLMVTYYKKTSAEMEREMSQSMLQTLKQAEINISSRLGNVEDASNSLIANPDLFRYLTSLDKTPYEQFEQFQTLEKLLTSVERNRDIQRIRLFVQPELAYAHEGLHFFSLPDFEAQSDWFSGTLSRNGAIYWRSTYLQRYVGSDPVSVVSSSRMLRDPANFDHLIGVLVIDVKEQLLQDIVSHMALAPSQDVSIVDQTGRIVADSVPDKIGTMMTLSASPKNAIFSDAEGYIAQHGHSGPSIVFHRIPLTNWTIVARIPAFEVSGSSLTMTKLSAVIVLTLSFVAFIFALVLVFAYVAQNLSRRLRELIRMMKTGNLDSLDSLSGTLPQGELRKLEHSISTMVQTVQDLTAESYQAKLHEREAQLKALQAQINPHFLYNTLDSINWMAIRRQADDISEMIDSLSTYFRLTLSKGQDVVTLDEELLLIRAYMRIQNTRNDGGIRMVYDIDEDALICPVPKLTLQPIVENAVLHGINFKRPKHGTIAIEVRKSGPWLRITVQDDGVGIDSERLETLLKSPSSLSGRSYGLYNVQERIRLYSQHAEAGIAVASEVGRGTRVMLSIKSDCPDSASARVSDPSDE